MSLLDLTRNSFQSGLSPRKWVDLCKLAIRTKSTLTSLSSNSVESLLSNSVLDLFRYYQGDPVLQEYLRYALRDGFLSNAVFVSTFLQAAKSPEFHDAATLDALCRIALDARYSSATSAFFSLDTPSVSSSMQDAFSLLRIANSLARSSSDRLLTSASEFLDVLLSYTAEMSQISSTQAMVLFADANDVLQTIQLSPGVRHDLETFAFSLSFLIGDDKIAREAQMMHSMQITSGKIGLSDSHSGTDVVTCSLVLNHLVSFSASEFGSGNGVNAVGLLVCTWRWSSWTLAMFLTQLLFSALTCLSQQPPSTTKGPALLWKAFIIGRLPRLLAMFEKSLKPEGITESDMKALLHSIEQTGIWGRCDRVISPPNATDDTQENNGFQSIQREFVQQLLSSGLVSQSFVDVLNPSAGVVKSQLLSEAQEAGQDLAAYFDVKLMPESNHEDARAWLDRVWSDPSSHAVFADVVLQRLENLACTFDVESLSYLCKMLYTHEDVLDIISLHVKISDIIFHTLTFLEDYDCQTVGDPQTAVTYLGDVVLFIQSTVIKFNFGRDSFTVGGRTTDIDLIVTPAFAHPVDSLVGEDAAAFNTWFKALFDSSSEGIDDNILRSTRPKILLRICATLFSQAIAACAEHRIDVDVLNNGVSYFLGPLLNWTLMGVIKALLQEIQIKSMQAPAHLEILQTLLLSPSCPPPVLSLCSPSILRLLRECKGRKFNNIKFDIASVQNIALQFVRSPAGPSSHLNAPHQPRQLIRNALAAARTGKPPGLPLATCLIFLPPTKFILLLWAELRLAASLGGVDVCRRLGTFALTTPSARRSPPLLPIFLHVIVPTLIANFDAEQPLSPDQIMDLDLLVALISSSLICALHLEYALRSQGQNQPAATNFTLSMGRRLLSTLKSAKHAGTGKGQTAAAITQRLAAIPTFVTNFPMFRRDS